jgi:hypothetical protein
MPAAITVTVAGNLPMWYRWRQNSRYVLEYSTNSLVGIISFDAVQLTNAGTYSVGVSNMLGAAVRISQNAILTVLPDSDHDRIPNAWETQYGFDPEDPADGMQDADGDGMENWKEYFAGTDPRDPTSYLRVSRFTAGGGQATVTFNAVSNRTYTLQFADGLGATWSPLQSVPSRTTNRVVSVIDAAAPNPTRFYRLAIP